MRAINQLLHTRTRVRPRYALMPAEGFPTSRIPSWNAREVRVLAAPQLGAKFAQYKIELDAGQGTRQPSDGSVESFFYVLSGSVDATIESQKASLTEGGYGLVPHTSSFAISATAPSSLLVLRKVYEQSVGLEAGKPILANQSQVRAETYLGNPNARLQVLIPDDLRYDLAMNIFTFDPGHCLPYVETHVMEHGLLFLQGKGVYFLDDEWMEVEAGDFIWMGPYCPQAFYATGNVPSRYIYYKNVNREIAL